MGWLTTAAVLTLLWFLPLGIRAVYNTDGANVRLIVGPVSATLYPRKKTSGKHSKTNQKKSLNDDSFETQNRQSGKNGGKLTDFLPLVQTIVNFLDGIRKKLSVNLLELKLILAGDDPCDLGINYGKAWAALGNLMPQLERVFRIKKRNLEVECDFTSDETVVVARIAATILLGRILCLAVFYGIRALKQYVTILNQRKGGAGI